MAKSQASFPDIGRVTVKVTPKAKCEKIVQDTDANGDPVIKVYVTAAPEDGKANKAVIALLAKYYGVPKSSLSVISGETSRVKVIARD